MTSSLGHAGPALESTENNAVFPQLGSEENEAILDALGPADGINDRNFVIWQGDADIVINGKITPKLYSNGERNALYCSYL